MAAIEDRVIRRQARNRRSPELQHLLVATMVAIAVVRWGLVVFYQLVAPHDLAYESPNLTTIRLIQEGVNIYDPAIYAHPPFHMTIYTPLYHHLVALLPTDGPNPFFYGRLLALVCMVLAATAVLAVRPRAKVTVPLMAASAFLMVSTVAANTAFLKNDSLALCFSVWAVVIASMSDRWRPAAYWAALLCILAFASKQSYLPASLACLIFLRRDPRFVLSWALMLATGLALSMSLWGGGFWFSVFSAPQNPISLERQAHLWGEMLRDSAFGAIIVVGCIGLYRSGSSNLGRHPFGHYALFSWLALLVTAGKAGSSTNYFIEPALATLLWMVFCLRSEGGSLAVGGAALAGLVAISPLPAFTTPAQSSAAAAREARFTAELRHEGVTPSDVLNLRSAPLGYSAGSRFQLNDPLLYGLLYHQKKLATQSLVRALDAQLFAAVAWPMDNSHWVASPELDDVRRALERTYPRRKTIAGEIFALPRD